MDVTCFQLSETKYSERLADIERSVANLRANTITRDELIEIKSEALPSRRGKLSEYENVETILEAARHEETFPVATPLIANDVLNIPRSGGGRDIILKLFMILLFIGMIIYIVTCL